MSFKVGDKVKIRDYMKQEIFSESRRQYANKIATITHKQDIYRSMYIYKLDIDDEKHWWDKFSIEPIPKEKQETTLPLADYTTDELKQEIECRKNKRWKPENEEYYHVICSRGILGLRTWDNGEYDKDAYAYGNIYRTEEKAQFAANKRKALVRMHDWARRYDSGEYIIAFDGTDVVIAEGVLQSAYLLPTFCEARIAQRFIDTFHIELVTYIFNE